MIISPGGQRGQAEILLIKVFKLAPLDLPLSPFFPPLSKADFFRGAKERKKAKRERAEGPSEIFRSHNVPSLESLNHLPILETNYCTSVPLFSLASM